jgi:hypothetical protein
VETVPVETVPVETVPVETVPVETVPVETVPVETVPVETVPPTCGRQARPQVASRNVPAGIPTAGDEEPDPATGATGPGGTHARARPSGKEVLRADIAHSINRQYRTS